MLRFAKFAWLAVLLVGFQSAFGFALLGPYEAWQTSLIGYNLSGADRTFGSGSADIGAPKKIGEGYRRNTPVMYYSLNAYFLNYFGSNGIVAIDKCFDILNGVPPVSQLSADLSEYPLEAQRINPTAEALFLLDVKTTALAVMVENLGLAEPERYIWSMHDRFQPAGSVCPDDTEYLIVKRNYDPVTWEPSSYVNGTLYSYIIDENCAAPPPPVWRALCHPYPVDLDADTFTAIASGVFFPGGIYTGLTRDDVGGLRYLLLSNNVAWEFPPTNSATITTNTTTGQFLVTSNLTELAQLASTTNAAALQAIIPGLVITGTSNWWTQFYTTNLTLVGLRNGPYDPIGTPPHIPVYQTNWFINFAQRYQHTFGNLVTFVPTAGGWRPVPLTTLPASSGRAFVSLQTTTASASPWDPSGTLVTNSTIRTYLTNAPVGDYAVLPTNSCGLFVAASLFTNVYSTTNLLTSTNTVSLLTNSVSGSTNVAQFSQSLVQYYTNHFFWIYTADCGTNQPALRQGIEKITYVRRNYDSLLGRFFQPITNTYTMMVVTNYGLVPQTVQRVLGFPDFLFSADDLTAGPGATPSINGVGRNIQFTTDPGFANIPQNPGPGIIEPGSSGGYGSTFTFNNTAPVYANIGGVTGNEATGFPALIWGSFDMTTNAPIVYPSGTSIKDLENMLLIQVTPDSLPEFTIGVDSNYNVQLETHAATPNWDSQDTTWKVLKPELLPPGIDFSSDGVLSGVPSTVGSYNFVVRVTDAAGRYVDRAYTIQVN